MPLSSLSDPLRIRLANGLISSTRTFVPNATITFGTHHATRDFVMTAIDGFDVILGKPWLTAFNPQVNWQTNTITAPFQASADSSPTSTPVINLITAKRMAKFLRHPDVTACYGLLTQVPDSPPPSPPDPFKPTDTALSPENLSRLHATLDSHRDIFSEPTGLNDSVPTHRINLLPNSTPPNHPLRRMSPAELQELLRQLETYLAKGWIRPSSSEYGAPVLFASKPDGSLRFCIDYRALNAITVKDRYPLPRVDDLLDQLYGAKYFSSLDLWQGYHQTRIHPEDIHKTAFKTRYGQYEFTVLPFGLTNAPSSFMRLMHNVLRPYLDKFAVAFIDDVLIYSKTEEEHLHHLDLVLTALQTANLHVKMSKCNFAQSSTTFLGYVVSSAGLAVDPRKVAAVADWPLPHDLHSTRAFLGFTGFYRRFIKDYAKLAAALTSLTKTTTPFPSSLPRDAIDSFHALKAALTTAPVLVIPFTGPDATFELYTDASGKGIGAVLLQDQGRGPQPVCYESRKFNPAELNYAVHEQELAAVVYACVKFRHYLDGCKHFTLYTDHHSLRFFFTQRDLSKRQARWAQTLAPFQPNMTIQYRPGHLNQADSLSRLFHIDVSSLSSDSPSTDLLLRLADLFPAAEIVPHDTLLSDISSAYADDPLYLPENPRRPSFLHLRENLWYFKDRICVPQNRHLRLRILQEYHDSPSAGHPGYHKTLNAVAQHYWWPHMTRSVRSFVSSCATCQRIKPSSRRSPGLLQPHAIPERPWSHISTDLITDLPPSLCHDSLTYDSIITFVCMLTKQALFIRANKTVTAKQLANIFIDHVYSKKGLPQVIVSDRDPRFTSDFWSSLFSSLHTTLNLSTSHHPQTDGQTERTHRTIEQILRAYCHPLHDDWSTWLPLAEFAYNNSVHSSTGSSPFYANYGYHPHTPASLILPPGSNPDAHTYIDRLRDIQHTITSELDLAKARQSAAANRHRRDLQFQIGDLVRLSSDFINLSDQPSSKLRHRFLGPFKVTAIISPVSYRLELPSSMSRVHPVFHVSRLLPWTPNPESEFPDRPTPPQPIPAARDYVHGDVYTVDRITDVCIQPDPSSTARLKADNIFFRVKWAPPYQDPSFDSWEPYRNLNKLDALKAFLASPSYQAFVVTPPFKSFASKYPRKVPKFVTFQL